MKKIFKKSLAIMVSAAICLTALIGCLSVSAATRGKGTFTVGSISGKPGESVTVPIKLAYTSSNGDDGMGIAASLFDVSFDTNALTITDIAAGEDATYMPDVEDKPGGADVPPQDIYTVEYRSNGETISVVGGAVRILAMPADKKAVVTSMQALLTFKINDGAEAKAYDITVTKQQTCDFGIAESTEVSGAFGNFEYTGDAEFIDMTVTNGKITVIEDHVHTEATCEFVSATDTEFIYSCTCTTCDETFEKRIPISETTSNIQVGRTIKPANDISLWFMFPKTATEGFTNLILLTEKEVYAPNEDTPTIEKGYIDEYQDGLFLGVNCDSFIFDNLAAYEMGNNVSAKLYGLNNDGEMQLLKQTSYSILEFINAELEKSTVNVNLKKTFVDILNYGAASQLLPDIMVDVNNLVNKDLTPELVALGTPESEYCTPDTDFDYVNSSAVYNESAQYGKIMPGVTIAPESKVNMYFMMNTSQFTGSTDNLYCKFYYNDVMGEPQEYVCKYDGTTRNGNPAFKFDLQPIAQLNSAVKAVFYYGDPDNGGEWMTEKEYSLTAFIKSQIGNPVSPEVGKVLQTIYAYGYSLQYCINNGLV